MQIIIQLWMSQKINREQFMSQQRARSWESGVWESLQTHKGLDPRWNSWLKHKTPSYNRIHFYRANTVNSLASHPKETFKLQKGRNGKLSKLQRGAKIIFFFLEGHTWFPKKRQRSCLAPFLFYHSLHWEWVIVHVGTFPRSSVCCGQEKQPCILGEDIQYTI